MIATLIPPPFTSFDGFLACAMVYLYFACWAGWLGRYSDEELQGDWFAKIPWIGQLGFILWALLMAVEEILRFHGIKWE